MSRKKLTVAVIVILLLFSIGAALVWWYIPRPLLDGAETHRIYYAQVYADGTKPAIEVDVEEHLDQGAVLDVLGRYQRNRSGEISASYSVVEGMICLGALCDGGPDRWHIVACPEYAFAYTAEDNLQWNIQDGDKLWKELQLLLPEF